MNDYFTPAAPLAPATKARSIDINNLAAAVAAAFDKVPGLQQLVTDLVNYGVDSGGVNAIAVTINAGVAALLDGLEVRVKVGFTPTITTPTLNVNNLGAVVITRNDGTPIQLNDIPAGICRFSYNATTARWVFAPPGARGAAGPTGGVGTLLRSIVSSAAPVLDASLFDEMEINALAVATVIAAPTNLPTVGNPSLIYRMKDNGIQRAIAWNTIFRAGTDVALPTSTVVGKWLYMGFKRNSVDGKLDLIAAVNI
jgi:hypothetical protein